MVCHSLYCTSVAVMFLLFIYHGLTQNISQVNRIKILPDKAVHTDKGYDKQLLFNLRSLTNSSKRMILDKITNKCAAYYSVPCLILDLSYLIDKLGQTKSFHILPGISIIYADNSTTTDADDLPEVIAASVVRSNPNTTDLHSYLLRKLVKYFRSLTIRVNLFDNVIVQNIRDFATNAVRAFFFDSDSTLKETGRGKKKKDSSGNMWSLAMMLALSSLAALAGKALLAGTIALVLSLLCLLRGCGGQKSAHYEIITKPAHLAGDVEHLGLSGSIANSYGGYARHLIQDRIIPALNIFDNNDESYDDKELVQEVIRVPYSVTPSYGHNAVLHRDNMENSDMSF